MFFTITYFFVNYSTNSYYTHKLTELFNNFNVLFFCSIVCKSLHIREIKKREIVYCTNSRLDVVLLFFSVEECILNFKIITCWIKDLLRTANK